MRDNIRVSLYVVSFVVYLANNMFYIPNFICRDKNSSAGYCSSHNVIITTPVKILCVYCGHFVKLDVL